ncbi:SDR family oxidoreductase [Chloroflexota bacterium]
MILITGAHGFIGRHLVAGLLDAGWSVRVLVPTQRGRVRLPWTEEQVRSGQGIDVVMGNLDDPDALAAALDGVHTIFHLAGALWWGGARDVARVDVDGTAAIIQAGQRKKVGRLIVVSHLGAAPASAYNLMRAKGQAEHLVTSSGVPYTIIRSGIVFGEQDRFVNNLAMILRLNPLLFIQPGQGENLLHPLYINDLVAVLVQCMDNLDTIDRILDIGGPEYLTFNEMVRTVMRVSGARRMILTLPPYMIRFFTRLMGRIFRRWPVTPQWFDIIASHRTASLGTVFDVFGIKPARFEDTLVQYMPERRYLWELIRFLFSRRRGIGHRPHNPPNP